VRALGVVVAVVAVAGSAAAGEVKVDPRVELLSLLFYLAGAPEYGRAYDTPYRRAVDAHFGAFKSHPAVDATRELRRRFGISHNAPPALAVQLDERLAPRVSLAPLPATVDDRWRGADLPAYLSLVADFARASGFDDFFAGQRPYLGRVEARVAAAVAAAKVDAWFDAELGPRAGARFVLCPGMLVGPWSYSATVVLPRGEEIFQVIALEGIDDNGLPVPTATTIDLVVHERAHAYVNPVVDARAAEAATAAADAFAGARATMERQAYTTPKVMVQESVVRALRVMFVRDRRGDAEGAAALRDEERRGFAWTGPLAERLAGLRVKGRLDLARSMPAVLAFFRDAGKKVAPSGGPP
jgi:hypothetical protein